MPKRGHTEEEILRALREVEAGVTGAAVCRKLGTSKQTLYVWKKQYAGFGPSELRELQQFRLCKAWSAWSFNKIRTCDSPCVCGSMPQWLTDLS